ncbi:MAG: lipopolysaccharide heptosyltransferase II [Thiomonas sp.]
MTRALLVAPQWIGDAVMAQPLVALLAARGEQITALALPAVAPVLRAMPGVVDVIEAPFAHGRLDLRLRLRLAVQVRSSGFDRAYVLGNTVKSRLVPWLARIPRRIGHRGEARGLLLTDVAAAIDTAAAAEPLALSPLQCRISRAPRTDMRQHYAALAAVAAAASTPQPLAEPVLTVAAADAAAARARFDLPPRWIALCPGAEYGPAKQWPVTHFAALAALAQQAGYAVAVLGSARDAPSGQAIAAQVPGVRNLCGATQLADAIALLASSSGVVSNDSGLMHIAAALRRPTVGVYGSTDPRHTPPAAHRSAVIWLQLDCSPCFARTCPLGHLDCLHGISARRVWDTLGPLLAAAAGSTPEQHGGDGAPAQSEIQHHEGVDGL